MLNGFLSMGIGAFENTPFSHIPATSVSIASLSSFFPDSHCSLLLARMAHLLR